MCLGSGATKPRLRPPKTSQPGTASANSTWPCHTAARRRGWSVVADRPGRGSRLARCQRGCKRASTSGRRPFSNAIRLRDCWDTRDETRTRKTRRSGDFESPASTNSATRALRQCSRLPGAAQRARPCSRADRTRGPNARTTAAAAAERPAHPVVAADGSPRAGGASHPECRRTSRAARVS